MSTFVPFVSDDEVVVIGCGLTARTLPKSQWTHSAHFAALRLMDHGPNGDAENTLPGLIRAYNEATGTVNSDSGMPSYDCAYSSLPRGTKHEHNA
jgi:hypothetical protein